MPESELYEKVLAPMSPRVDMTRWHIMTECICTDQRLPVIYCFYKYVKRYANVYRFGFFAFSTSYIYLSCALVSVRPQGVSIDGLDQPVREGTEVEVKCRVKRVKPAADIYWKKGADGTLHRGIPLIVTNNSDGTFQLESTYKVPFSRRDNGKKLHCLVTRPNNRTDVWKTVDRNVSVICEYNMVSSCRDVRSVYVSITWCPPVEMLEVCL